MAITRRQFVTRLGALAAAAGFSQVEASKIMEAVAYNPNAGVGAVYQGTFGKPRVVWIHGAECTGCSTSLLGIFENRSGIAVEGTSVTTAGALISAQALPVMNPVVDPLFPNGTGVMNTTLGYAGLSPDPSGSIDIADVVIDVIDLIYHETVQGMGGDLAYQWLANFEAECVSAAKPYVLVVEGALQKTSNTGAWGGAASTTPWCSVAAADDGSAEIVPAEFVQTVGESAYCVAIIPIGQCATFGGYPGCKPRITNAVAGFDTTKSQTDAMGVHAYLVSESSAAADKVINVPGCPTNPWWFVLSVVCFIVDVPSIWGTTAGTVGTLRVLKSSGVFPYITINPAAVDGDRRLKAVYSNAVHSPYCSKLRYYVKGVFAANPGDRGCLQKIGCKGPAARSLCTTHGWNNQQPQNIGMAGQSAAEAAIASANTAENGGGPYQGGNCTRAGHPCMACTEKGYPDNFVPFVVRS